METCPILKVIVGSRAHGLATDESDWDYRGVFAVPTRELLSIGGQKVKNTQWIEGQNDDTGWELGHFLDLATHCNPTILETFLAPMVSSSNCPEEGYIGTNNEKYAQELRDLFPYIWNSKGVFDAFQGYSKNQQKKFLDRKDSRPHKYASAYLRVLYQGVQLLKTGSFPVDFRETRIYDTLRHWKNKDYSLGEVMEVTASWEEQMLEAYEDNPNKETNLEPVNEFLLKLRQNLW